MGFPLFKNKFSLFEFRLGAGLGVFSNRFNLETNLKNSAISSRINSAVNFLFQYSVNITNRSELLAGFSLTHWSNAAFEIPNAGINVFGANLGVNIDIGKRVPINYQSFPIVEKNWHFMSWIGIYLKETNPVDRGKYVAGTLGFDALKRFSRKSSFGAGLNLMYDRTLNVRDPNLNTPFRVGITLCYELHAGRISFPIQQGFYVYDAFGKDAIIYQRIGVKYRVRKNLFVNFTLKTHYAVADYAELGFGYLIK